MATSPKLGQPILQQGEGDFWYGSGHSPRGGFKWGQAIQHEGRGELLIGARPSCRGGCCRGGGLLFGVRPFCMEGKVFTANTGNYFEKLTDFFGKVAGILRKSLIILRKYVDFFQTKLVSMIFRQIVNNFVLETCNGKLEHRFLRIHNFLKKLDTFSKNCCHIFLKH